MAEQSKSLRSKPAEAIVVAEQVRNLREERVMDPVSVPAVPLSPLVSSEEPGASVTQTTTDTTSTVQMVGRPSWVSIHLRNFVVIVLTNALVYLALVERNDMAITALITAWTWSAGGMFQERAALKKPGQDS